eukprot:CAMPEP_0198199666 /NCGR_PEP_ID=MMETSP1445-20131203/2885_1 /TAXON_ID=36898 /ORGANISM="Pyramimonas sp., Strain CCMP2087" /LENGTH=276 /DNA_ID=CAMNT_0043869551 /DNA_START=254 /DNA_END=1084 /DNA_ORIENTATION=+
MSTGLMSNSNLKLLGGDERMERTDSASSFDPKGSLSREMAWLRQCLPIILQPKLDIQNGYGLVRIFFNFRHEVLNNFELICELELVYEGEGCYSRPKPTLHNDCATYGYRAKNLHQYGRTGDINHMQFRGVNVSGTGQPWRSVYTVDSSGDQSWSQGNGGDCFSWFSIMKHYQKEVAYDEWQRRGDRPLLYVNTFNHMMGPRDSNPKMQKFHYERYAVSRGTRDDAERFVKTLLPVKPNFYSMMACWLWCSILGGWEESESGADEFNDVSDLLYTQ